MADQAIITITDPEYLLKTILHQRAIKFFLRLLRRSSSHQNFDPLQSVHQHTFHAMPSSQPMTIRERIRAIQATLTPSVRMIAVSKYMPVELIRQAYAAGIRDFGESRVQEAVHKMSELNDLQDITWHLIGHLQGNKAKLAVENFDWIHSVDSLSLAQRLNRLVETTQHSPQLCLQIKILSDPDKFGWSVPELKSDFSALQACTHLKWRGLMTILPMGLTDHETLDAFQQLQGLSTELTAKTEGFYHCQELSMGMSNDYPLAIEAGATMVRLGRCLFGDRPN